MLKRIYPKPKQPFLLLSSEYLVAESSDMELLEIIKNRRSIRNITGYRRGNCLIMADG
jgi:hypothetical protein